jgi:hypothetical protein
LAPWRFISGLINVIGALAMPCDVDIGAQPPAHSNVVNLYARAWSAGYEAARTALGDAALVELTLAVATINAWNRLNIAFRAAPGAYQPGAR